MPRGVKGHGNYMAQIEKLEEKIQKYSSHLAVLKEQRQELMNKQRESDMQELHAYMQEHGLSSRDIINQLATDQQIPETSDNDEAL